MSKEKQKNRTDTESALSAAQTAQAEAAKALASAEQTFETDQSQPAWARVISCRGDLEYCDRILAFAQNAHDAAVRAEQERIAAEAERVRLETLAKINADAEENLRAATEACTAIAKTYARGWELAIAAQSVGGSGLNGYNSHVIAALFDAMIAAGNAPSALRFV